MSENFAVIICAAGKSTRLNSKKKKPFVDVANKPVFLYSVELFSEREDVKQIILAVGKDDMELVKLRWAEQLSFFCVKLCEGGARRFETVSNALEMVNDDIDFVAVHDAARCCLKPEWVENVFAEARENSAAILASPVTDTIKQAEDSTVEKTIHRGNLWCAQTPQVFEKKLLEKGYANLENLDKDTISDDSQLVEALGENVKLVDTDTSNIKITHKEDLAIAEAIIKSRKKPHKKRPLGPYEQAKW
jgi:2-C-methyl-D-erythritol 4-phosphate cytidylyltransferase